MSVTDELLKNNERYASSFTKGNAPLPPARGVAVVACMDARLHVSAILGLEIGDAHIIRNAGGVVTDDAIRSLVISQRLLGTREIILIHHSDCGMVGGFKGSTQRLDEEVSRWDGHLDGLPPEPEGLQCDRLAVRRWRGVSIGSSSGGPWRAGFRVRKRVSRQVSRQRSGRVGSAKLAACAQSASLPYLRDFCRLPNARRSRSCTPLSGVCVTSLATSAVLRPRSRVSCAAMR
jgi:hypothetical protein